MLMSFILIEVWKYSRKKTIKAWNNLLTSMFMIVKISIYARISNSKDIQKYRLSVFYTWVIILKTVVPCCVQPNYLVSISHYLNTIFIDKDIDNFASLNNTFVLFIEYMFIYWREYSICKEIYNLQLNTSTNAKLLQLLLWINTQYLFPSFELFLLQCFVLCMDMYQLNCLIKSKRPLHMSVFILLFTIHSIIRQARRKDFP